MRDELVIEDPDSAEQVVARIEDSPGRVVLGQTLVFVPVEAASVTQAVHIGKLQQPVLAHDAMRNRVDDCDGGIGVARTSAVGCRPASAPASAWKKLPCREKARQAESDSRATVASMLYCRENSCLGRYRAIKRSSMLASTRGLHGVVRWLAKAVWIMAARVVHIGTDNCHRVPVLESAGYAVDGCSSLKELHQALRQLELKAVLVGESEGVVHRDMIREVRQCSDAPVVLFREALHFPEPGEELFDLEVPVLQPPDAWLPNLAALIARSQELRAQSREIRGHALRLCQETAIVRERSQRERQRSGEMRKKIPHPEGLVRGPEDGGKS